MLMGVSFLLALSGCITNPPRENFPEPPGNLMIEPPKYLENLKDQPGLDDVGSTVNHNYITYHLVARQLLDLQMWIREQIKINKD